MWSPNNEFVYYFLEKRRDKGDILTVFFSKNGMMIFKIDYMRVAQRRIMNLLDVLDLIA